MKKGFTIVELLAVITIIGVLIVLVVPSVNNLIIKTEENGYTFQINSIKDSSVNFTLENIDVLLSDNKYESFTIDLKTLKDLAFLDYELKNPKTNKYFSDDTQITLTRNKGNYNATILPLDSHTISEEVKYVNHFILIKNNGDGTKNDVFVFNINGGEYIGEYTVDVAPAEPIIEGYNTFIYTVTVGTDKYSIKKFNKI